MEGFHVPGAFLFKFINSAEFCRILCRQNINFFQATLAFDWDLNDELKEEGGSDIRPDFEAKCKKKKKNPVTGAEEPYFPTLARIPRYLRVAKYGVWCVV